MIKEQATIVDSSMINRYIYNFAAKTLKVEFNSGALYEYKDVESEKHLTELMERTPIWQLLEHKDFVDKVFHLSGHDSLLKQLKPTSVVQLAATLAIIRPAKKYLANESWEKIHEEVWQKPTNGEYFFKKAHAYAYAQSVVVHMNLLCEMLESES